MSLQLPRSQSALRFGRHNLQAGVFDKLPERIPGFMSEDRLATTEPSDVEAVAVGLNDCRFVQSHPSGLHFSLSQTRRPIVDLSGNGSVQ